MVTAREEISKKIADKLTANEPRDGSHLIVQHWTGYMSVIWREDRNGTADRRWFTSHDSDPLSLGEHLADCMAVFALGDCLAGFQGAY